MSSQSCDSLQTSKKQVGQKLRPNPFTTYRDSETGEWIVVIPVAAS